MSTSTYTGFTSQLVNSTRFAFVMLILCGGIYTTVVTLAGESLFPFQANGSLLYNNDNARGSSLIAQRFDSPQYFYGRPSAADFDPTSTGGSNLAPSNPALAQRVQTEAARIAKLEGVEMSVIPTELLAQSGAGLDPHISPEVAIFQLPRVARVRGMSEKDVLALVEQHTESKQWGFLGQPRVNVLALNLSLDGIAVTPVANH